MPGAVWMTTGLWDRRNQRRGSILTTRRKPRQLAAPDANAEMFVSFVPLHSTLCFCGPCRVRQSVGSSPWLNSVANH